MVKLIKGGPKYATYFYAADAKYATYFDSKYATFFMRKIINNMRPIFYGSIATPKSTEFPDKKFISSFGLAMCPA